MAGEDYSLKTKVEADVSNFEKGMNKAEKSLKGFSDKLADNINRLGKKGLVGSIANVTLAMQGLTKSFGTVIKFAKDVGKAVNECTEAYKTQLIAERALSTAIENNPFITGASADALKKFASEMQKVSNYGDEELIPMMANLVSLGRTEAETMQIMSVAMDMSAGMGISLDTAITQLNATLNGNIGRLGQQNAELKGLTAEELKQGKAIEILGEKFKGLSGATADTSKQLQNIKGDFKEALGQFTLPSSDMWNKFWAGFYERGIEVIGKLNAYIDAQTIGKKTSNFLVEQLAPLEYYGDRIKYLRDSMHLLADDELSALGNYLKGLKNVTEEQKQILNFVEQEELRRKDLQVIEKENAEKKKLIADAEAKATEEAKKQLEIAQKKTDWEGKLLDQRIEILETEKKSAVSNAEEIGKETYTIEKYYNDKILELRLSRLEKEKEKALEEEGLTAEDKTKINEYYKNEEEKIYNELGQFKKKKKEEEKKEERKSLAEMLDYVKKYAENVAKVISKITSTIKNVFSAVGNIFNSALNLFNFNPDEALVNLLKIEDSILTFFVETLPKLPAFFASAVQSIMVLLDNLINRIDWGSVQSFLNSVIDVIIQNIPTVVENLLIVVINIAQALIKGLERFIASGGWKMILDLLLKVQKRIEEFIIDNIDSIAQTISDMLPDLIQFLIDSVVSASGTLARLIKPIMKLIVALIDNIVDFLFSDEIFEASIDVTIAFIEALAEELLPKLSYLIPKIIIKVIGFIVKNLPKLVKGIIEGLIQGFIKTNWFEVIKQCFMGFIDAFKDLFGIHSPSTLFESFGTMMVQGLVNGLKGIAEAVSEILTPLFDLIDDLFDSVLGSVDFTISTSFDGLLNTLTAINDVVVKLTTVSFAGLNGIIESSGNAFANITNSVANLLEKLTKLVEVLNKIVSIGGGSGVSLPGISTGGTTSGGSSPISNPVGYVVEKGKEVVDYISNAVEEASSGGGYGSHSTGSTAGDIAVDLFVPGGFLRHFFANGSNSVPQGLALVGEAGPELVKFRGGEQVLNNRNTNKALAEAGGKTNNFNVTFNNLQDTSAFAMINQLKQYNRQMAINGII